MNAKLRANVNIRIYQLTRKLEQLHYDAKHAQTQEEAQSLLDRAREIEFIIGY